MLNRWQHVWRLLALSIVTALMLTGCGDPTLSALIPSGPVAEEQLTLIKLSLFIMVGVIVVVMLIFAYVIIRYRKKPGQTGIPEQVEGNTKLEIIWTVIPIILLFILAVPTVMTTFTLAKDYSDEEGVVNVKVTAHQFWWEFEYPDLGVATAQDLYIPTGKRVMFQLTSKDVVHSFWVPSLGGKTDNVPGLVNKMWLQADKEGVYQGKCAELCGASHALMDFKVVAVSPQEFDSWVEKMKAGPAEPATATAKEGQQVFQQSCIGCHAVGNQGGKLGPNLTAFGDREKLAGILENNPELLKQWIANPNQFKEGNRMPAFGEQLNEEQIDALAEYLSGLKIR
ncbi:cytochrome c oxidase subunit II [Brevibacillus humidisoli]|uniref:cytochrome c oxidase subunit II n=1 Tax=Brevibacillus humidisoli TaxID=2895522 RepID=UPI001E28EAFD|nr:cytochrome c oxidase subunit II [Brevibacillus humidisoli]UFJ42335.1 cytochrome c oxidase subunit II [Brevibacillus humidisoli]